MKDDLSVLISRTESKGAALRARGDRLEVWGLDRLAPDLVDELKDRRSDLVKCLSHRDAEGRKTAQLLAWASELAEQELRLERPVRYTEAPRRMVSTIHASWYATQYLRTIALARQRIDSRRSTDWPPQWWREREEEGIAALRNLRTVLENGGKRVASGGQV